jgi:hypothetical protein
MRDAGAKTRGAGAIRIVTDEDSVERDGFLSCVQGVFSIWQDQKAVLLARGNKIHEGGRRKRVLGQKFVYELV